MSARSEDNARFVAQGVIASSAVTLFALFAFIVVPGILGEGRVEESVASGQKSSAAGEGWLDPAEAPAREGRDIPPVDPSEVLTPNQALLERGRALYSGNCVPCHGPEGKGDGPSAESLEPRPRDFSKQAGWKNGYRVTDVYRTLTEGIPGSAMGAYEYLPPKERMALVHWVRSLGAFEHGPEDPAAQAALSEQFRKPGGRVPGHIPVSVAMSKLEREFTRAAPLAPPSGDGRELELFRRAVADPGRAAQVLEQSPAWRRDPGALARTAAGGAPANGFSVRTATLAPEDWKRLQAMLNQSAGRAEETTR